MGNKVFFFLIILTLQILLFNSKNENYKNTLSLNDFIHMTLSHFLLKNMSFQTTWCFKYKWVPMKQFSFQTWQALLFKLFSINECYFIIVVLWNKFKRLCSFKRIFKIKKYSIFSIERKIKIRRKWSESVSRSI